MFAAWKTIFEETHVFHRLIPTALFAAYLFAGAFAFQKIEENNGAFCPNFTYWSSFFYLNTVIATIGFPFT